MKKTFLAILLATCTNVFAQTTNEETPFKKNEIRINVFNSLIGTIDFQYERILSETTTLGLNAGIGYGDEWSEGYSPKYNVSPNLRFYFSKKRAAGFFVETSAIVSKNVIPSASSFYPKQTSHNFGLGAAAGYKLVNKANFVMSTKLGIGRYLTNQNNNSYLDPTYPVCEVSIGTRF